MCFQIALNYTLVPCAALKCIRQYGWPALHCIHDDHPDVNLDDDDDDVSDGDDEDDPGGNEDVVIANEDVVIAIIILSEIGIMIMSFYNTTPLSHLQSKKTLKPMHDCFKNSLASMHYGYRLNSQCFVCHIH